ncbi:MAG: hypothetical protein P4M11_07085 [Candidatus Pacebacteria bacterium]|nr:hypothetical protein [Candidatus Paceibacterota bacterium]
MAANIVSGLVSNLLDDLDFSPAGKELVSDKSHVSKRAVFLPCKPKKRVYRSLLTLSHGKSPFVQRRGGFYIEPPAESDPNYHSIRVSCSS